MTRRDTDERMIGPAGAYALRNRLAGAVLAALLMSGQALAAQAPIKPVTEENKQARKETQPEPEQKPAEDEPKEHVGGGGSHPTEEPQEHAGGGGGSHPTEEPQEHAGGGGGSHPTEEPQEHAGGGGSRPSR